MYVKSPNKITKMKNNIDEKMLSLITIIQISQKFTTRPKSRNRKNIRVLKRKPLRNSEKRQNLTIRSLLRFPEEKVL